MLHKIKEEHRQKYKRTTGMRMRMFPHIPPLLNCPTSNIRRHRIRHLDDQNTKTHISLLGQILTTFWHTDHRVAMIQRHLSTVRHVTNQLKRTSLGCCTTLMIFMEDLPLNQRPAQGKQQVVIKMGYVISQQNYQLDDHF